MVIRFQQHLVAAVFQTFAGFGNTEDRVNRCRNVEDSHQPPVGVVASCCSNMPHVILRDPAAGSPYLKLLTW